MSRLTKGVVEKKGRGKKTNVQFVKLHMAKNHSKIKLLLPCRSFAESDLMKRRIPVAL